MIWEGASAGLPPLAPLPSNSRVTREIERALKRGPTKHNKGKIEGHKLKIREIHNTLNAQNTPLDGALSSSERAPGSAPADSREAATTSASGSGMFSAPPLPISYGVLINSALSTLTFQPPDVWSDARSL